MIETIFEFYFSFGFLVMLGTFFYHVTHDTNLKKSDVIPGMAFSLFLWPLILPFFYYENRKNK